MTIEDANVRMALDDELLHLSSSPRPWSGKALVRLGKSIRTATRVEDFNDEYLDVMAHYQELSLSVQSCIEAACNTGKSNEDRLEVTSRAKSIDTLGEKLRRTPTIQLPAISDIAGVRVEGPMVLSQQDSLANSLCALFGHDPKIIRDLRNSDHSGYRAVHLWLEFPSGRVEVQIRTTLQGAWANAYEKAADFFGRGIRYDEYPEDEDVIKEIRALQRFSTERIAHLEEQKDAIWKLEADLPQAKRRIARLMDGQSHRRTRIHKKRQKILREHMAKLPTLEKELVAMKEMLKEDEEQTHILAKKIENAYMMMTNS